MVIIVKIYAKIYEFFHHCFQLNLPGLGLYRQLNKDTYLNVRGKKLFFNSNVADNYGMLINGNFNEKETHYFLDNVFENELIRNFHFVEIGGNIGEFVLDYSDHKNIKHLTVFEPQPQQIIGIKKTIIENKFENTTLIEKPVSNEIKEVNFNFNITNSTASGIIESSNTGTKLWSTTLDVAFRNNLDHTFVLLIDIEGQELNAIKGSEVLIKKTQPLIIFEYNHVTKLYFKIEDIQNELGKNYTIYRLNKKGRLDLKFDDIWNLVALPQNETFKYLDPLIDN